ncbi:MAG TPA: hypothetical protein VMP01_19895 [Pirellulaceae bacterium]|nr:hypothetical protein [Pirellulaceae bacterium]
MISLREGLAAATTAASDLSFTVPAAGLQRGAVKADILPNSAPQGPDIGQKQPALRSCIGIRGELGWKLEIHPLLRGPSLARLRESSMSTPPQVDLVSTPPASASPVEPPAPKVPQLNIYTVMLGLAFFFICLACLFLFFEMQDYDFKTKP